MELIKTLGGASPKEFAHQLTLFEWNLFHQISIKDLLDYSKGSQNKSLSIQASILWFNNLSNSITIDILKPELSQRVETLAFWILVGHQCRKMHNYNAVMEIVASLGGVAVSRLSRTWQHLPKKFVTKWKIIENLMSNFDNYKEYRSQLEKLAGTKSCAVPYLGIYLRDMVFIDENPATLGGAVNQFKVDLERQLITSVVKFQERNYRMTENIKLKMILDSWKKSNTNANVENGLYERSVLMEPSRLTADMLDQDLVKQICGMDNDTTSEGSSDYGAISNTESNDH